MRVMRGAANLLAGLALAALPIVAEAQEPVSGDLTCAAWTAVVGGEADGEDEGAADGLRLMLVYELGRYRGETGRDVQGSDMAAKIVAIYTDLEQVETECLAKMEQIFDSIAVMGADMQAAAAQMED